MKLFNRIRNSLVWRLIFFIILIQLLIVFVIYRNTLSQYDRYISENQAVTSVTVENAFTEYYQLQVAELAVFADEKIEPSISNERFFEYSWQHILDNNSDLWFIIQSNNFNLEHGDIPANARNINLFEKNETHIADGCYEATGRRVSQLKEYSVYEISCGKRGYLSWAIGGVNPQYELPKEFTEYEKSVDLLNIFKSASLFSLAIFFIIPLAIFILLRPVRKSAELVEKFSLSSKAVNLPLNQVPTELDAFVNAVNRTLQRVRDSYERENIFRAAMAHELRTPLTILRARIDLLKDSDMRDKLRNDVRAMTNLIDRLLLLAETTADQSDIGVFNLPDMVSEVVNDQQEFAAQNGQNTKLNLTNKQVLIQVNRDAFILALSNLIINSIRHGASEKPIEITVTNQGEVTIRDFGSGYSEHILAHLNASDSSGGKKTKKAHTGIGMMIIQSAMQSMKANVSFENASSGGAITRLFFTPYEEPK